MQLKSLHLLVTGDKQVGKSAQIVRLTTGRFIHNYSQTTDDWLYKRQLAATSQFNDGQSQIILEILELSWNQLESGSRMSNDENSLDQMEVRHKFQWAQALVVMYSITSAESFLRAKTCLRVAQRFHIRPSQGDHEVNNKETPNRSGPRQLAAPILILANKADLGSEARQVSLEEGQQLASESGCLFAEVSILEASASLLDELMLRLVGRLETSALSGHSASTWTCVDCGAETPLVRWQHKPTATCKLSSSQSSENIPRAKCAPVSSQLVRFQSSAVVAATVAFCRPLLSRNPTAPLEAAAAAHCRAPQPIDKSSQAQLAQVQTIGSPQPMAVSSCISRFQPAAKQRATSLRTSFKKASLAIVGGKTLAFKTKQPTAAEKQNLQQSTSSLQSCDSSTLSLASSSVGGGPKASAGKSANWIRSRFSLRQEAPAEYSQNQPLELRRPLFKYKERLKTVAFEPNYGATSDQDDPLNELHQRQAQEASEFTKKAAAEVIAPSSFDEQPLRRLGESAARKISIGGNSLSSYALNRHTSGSGRSSPSLSTSEAPSYGSLLIINQQQQQQQQQADQRPPSGARRQSNCASGQTSARASQQRPVSGDCGGCNSHCNCNLNRLESRCSSATIFNNANGSTNNHAHNLMMSSGHRTILNKLTQRKDSRSTLSRASTSGGSYGDDEDDDEEADDEVGPLGDELGSSEWPAANLWPVVQSAGECQARLSARQPNKPASHQIVTSSVGYNLQQPIIERLQPQQPALGFSSMISEAHQVVKSGKISFCKALIKSIASPNPKRPNESNGSIRANGKGGAQFQAFN